MTRTMNTAAVTMPATPPRTRPAAPPAEPFRNTEHAWFWTMSALTARREGTGRGGAGTPQPCDPDDIIKCLDGLYRQRRIDLMHARILRIWGERGIAPNPAYPGERCDSVIWREAMERLEWPLRVKGIIA